MKFLRIIFLICLPLLFQTTAFSQNQQAGLEALWLEDYSTAAAQFQRAVTTDPSEANHLLFGNALLASGMNDRAKEIFQKIAGDKRLGLVAKGRIQFLDKQPTEALKTFAKADRDARGKDAELLMHLGESFTFLKIPDSAPGIGYLKAALDKNSNNLRALMSLGQLYAANRKFGDAVTQFELAGTTSISPIPWYKVGTVYQAAKNNDLFLTNMEKALAADPSFAPALRDLGDHYYAANQVGKSKEYYTKYLALRPDAPVEDQMQFANILFLTKDYPAVIERVNEIVKKDDSKAYLRRLIGYSYYETGDFANGLAQMEDFFKKAPAEKILASDYEYLGYLLQKNEKDSAAALNFEKAFAMDAQKTDLIGKAGEIWFKSKKYADAARCSELKIKALGKPTAQDYFELGRAFFQGKEYVQADKAFSEIIRLRPDAATGYLWCGKTNLKLEPDIVNDTTLVSQYGMAKPHFEKYIEIAGKDPAKNKKDLVDAFNYLSYYYYVKEDRVNAKLYCQKTLELEPADKYAAELLTQL